MSRKAIAVIIVLAALLLAGIGYRFANLKTGGGHEEAGQASHEENAGHAGEGHGEAGHEEARAVEIDVETQKKYGITVAVAEKKAIGGSIASTGKVEVNSDRIAHVLPAVSGRVASVNASLGDYVKAGQSLARLDSVEIGQSLARCEQLKARAALAASNMERVKRLVEKKIAARKEILAAETEHLTALSELHAEEERLLLLGLSRADLQDTGKRRILLPVRSPISGTVTEKHVVTGEFADPSKHMYTVADLSSVWVQVDIQERDLAKVRKGQTAVVKANAFPEAPFRGKITYIADFVDEATRTVKARVEAANPKRMLKPEMFVSVELALPPSGPPVLAVPEGALQESGGKKVLFVTDDGIRFEPREVATGAVSGGMAEIVSGLEEGEKYASDGVFIIKSELGKGELGEHGH
ncbi:MAG TPA: efflux RND transporter periplasmic adaptor subunit [Nitrospirota bacterium]|nr:efflux RND transporter periplasmic adaptor subunit [Nitrospirota bacterium]